MAQTNNNQNNTQVENPFAPESMDIPVVDKALENLVGESKGLIDTSDYTHLFEAVGLFTTGVFFLLAVWIFFLFNIESSVYIRKLSFLSIILMIFSTIYFIITLFRQKKVILKAYSNKVILIDRKQELPVLKVYILKRNQFISLATIKILWNEGKETAKKLAPNLYYLYLPIVIFVLTILIIILYVSFNLLRVIISLTAKNHKEKNLVSLQIGHKITEFRLVLLTKAEQLNLLSYNIPIEEVGYEVCKMD